MGGEKKGIGFAFYRVLLLKSGALGGQCPMIWAVEKVFERGSGLSRLSGHMDRLGLDVTWPPWD